jgi:hypothetical protein
MYTRVAPEGEVKKYLDWILSSAGQCILLHQGYAPVRATSCPELGTASNASPG